MSSSFKFKNRNENFNMDDIEFNEDDDITIDFNIYSTSPFIFNEIDVVVDEEEKFEEKIKNMYSLVLKDIILFYLNKKIKNLEKELYRKNYTIVLKDIIIEGMRFNNDMWISFKEAFLK